MNVLFISPHFPPQYVHFCTALRAQGARVLGLGDLPVSRLAPELRAALHDYRFVHDLSDEAAAIEAVRGLVSANGAIQRIESLNEHWLGLEARLRDRFDVVGPRPEELGRWRSKSGMRALFRAAGIDCSEGEPARSVEAVRAFVARVGLPVVFKPDVGVGAARTFRVDSSAELEAVLQEPLDGFVVERFEPGRLTSYDGLVDRTGQVVFSLSHVYSAGVMEIVREQRTPWYHSRRTMPPALESIGRKVIAAFGLTERFFHIEFFEHEGRFRALEVNVRPPGGFTTDLMNWACDLDVYRLWARMLTGDDLASFTHERPYHAAHVGRRRSVNYRFDPAVLREKLGVSLMDHRSLPPALARAMGDEIYFLREADETRLARAIELVSAAS